MMWKCVVELIALISRNCPASKIKNGKYKNVIVTKYWPLTWYILLCRKALTSNFDMLHRTFGIVDTLNHSTSPIHIYLYVFSTFTWVQLYRMVK